MWANICQNVPFSKQRTNKRAIISYQKKKKKNERERERERGGRGKGQGRRDVVCE